MSVLDQALSGFFLFLRHLYGIVVNPYTAYRSIVNKKNLWGTLYIWLIVLMYFGLSSLVRVRSFRPFILTKHFVAVSMAGVLGFTIIVFSINLLGKLLGGKGTLKETSVAWGYTLIPTASWFLITSVLYLILPPPRTVRLQGLVFSLLFIVFSAVLFFWKLTLSYLTIRFSMRLDAIRIIGVFIPTLFIVGGYSVVMYWLGVFRIPFI